MTTLEKIRDIFAILHDGTISAWTGDLNFLTLAIDCKYLAEQIDKPFDIFYVELVNVDELFLSTWPFPFDLPLQTLTELNILVSSAIENPQINKAAVDILEGKMKAFNNRRLKYYTKE